MNMNSTSLDRYLKAGAFKGYFTPKQFWAFHKSIKSNHEYSNLLSDKEVIGKTIKGNAIYGIYLTNDAKKIDQFKRTKNILMLTALHHSREPLTITMIILMIINILKAFKSSGHNKMKEFFRDNIIFFIPTLNIDSYLYMTRMYRKNRAGENIMMIRKNRNIDKRCGAMTGGVDLNRNYGFKFGLNNDGSSDNPCAEDYRGSFPFSEKETQAIKSYVEAHDNIVSCVNIHSYGNAWIYPFNFLHDGGDSYLKIHQPLFYNFFKEFEGENKRKGIKAHFGNSAFVLDYETNGEAGDWFTGAKNILNLDVELGNNNKQSDAFYPPKYLIPKIVRYNWIVMNDFLDKHIVALDLIHSSLNFGHEPSVELTIFNQSLSSLKGAQLHLKPIFEGTDDVKHQIFYSFKMLDKDKVVPAIVDNNTIAGTFKGRYILELEVRFDSESLLKKFTALQVVIKRSEESYFDYPDETYTFKLKDSDQK